jgi:soluble lytic murein transglycosylase-like protein
MSVINRLIVSCVAMNFLFFMVVFASTDVFAAKSVKVKSKQRSVSYSHYKKAHKRSGYKKGFSPSKRRFSKNRNKRSSGCLSWNANKINDKASKFITPIKKYSSQYRVNRHLIKAVITAESCFRIKALSSAGAQGLMQLIPATAKRFGVKNSYMPKQNIHGGVKYLRFLLDRYKGDLSKTIAAYNAGEGAVDKYKGIPPYKETQQYVKNVMKVYKLLLH